MAKGKEENSIDELVGSINVEIMPLFDHFSVKKTQEDLDDDFARAKEIAADITASIESENALKVKSKNKEPKVYKINQMPPSEQHIVHTIGPDCTNVKIGDRVTIRRGTTPAEERINGSLYLFYSERSVSSIVKPLD